MIINAKGKEILELNLQSQVEYNKDRLDGFIQSNLGLSAFGIKVLGHYDTSAELYQNHPEATYIQNGGQYGDCFTIGQELPYQYYIMTRPFGDEISDHWFNIGEFPLPGPKGEKGDNGDKGDIGIRGNKILVGSGVPSNITGQRDDDIYIDIATYNLYQLNTTWNIIGNIKGSDGIGSANDLIPITENSDTINRRIVSDNMEFNFTGQIPYMTQAPTSNNIGGHLYIVYLEEEPETKYEGYLYLIKES